MLVQLGIIAIVRQQIKQANQAENYQYLSEESTVAASTIGEIIWDNLEFLQLMSYNGNITNALIQSNREYAKQGNRLEDKLNNSEKQWLENKEGNLVKNITGNTSAKELQKANDVITHLNEIYITNKYGALVSSTKYVDRFDYNEQSWWKFTYNQGKGNIYIGNLKFTENQDNLVLPIAIPIYTNSKSTEIIGVIYAEHRFDEELATIFHLESSNDDTENIKDHIHRIYMGNNSYLDYENQLISTEPQLTLDDIQEQLAEPKKFKYENTLNFLTVKQIKSLESDAIFSEMIENLNWYLVTITPHEQQGLFSLPSRILYVLVVAMVFLMLSIGFTLYILNKITNPLKSMIEVAENINNDCFEAKDLDKLDEAINLDNEIGQLANVFKQMAQLVANKTKNLQEQIEQMKQRGTNSLASDSFNNDDFGDGNVQFNNLKERINISILKRSRDLRSRLTNDHTIEQIPSLPNSSLSEEFNSNIPPEMKEIIQTELALYIGPLAEHIIDDTIANNPTMNSREFIELLAQEIPDQQKATQFQDKLSRLC